MIYNGVLAESVDFYMKEMIYNGVLAKSVDFVQICRLGTNL